MYWERMSLGEYAEYEGGNGTKLIKVDDVWWRAVRPFFYRPLFPFQRLSPNSVKPPSLSFLFGFQYPVIDEMHANSYLNLIVFDDIHDYSLDKLKKEKRNKIKKGLKNLSVRKIHNLDEFIKGGYKSYVSFFHRTKYKWKNDRVHYDNFTRWADHLFRHPKIVIDGVYLNNELSAINISYLVDDIIMDAVFFSTTEALKMGSSDVTWHTLRENAAESSGVRYIYEGPLSGNKGLDYSKIERGCKIICLPAFCSINRLLIFILASLNKKARIRLLGLDEHQVEKIYSRKKRE